MKRGVSAHGTAASLSTLACLAAFFIAFLMATGPGPFAADSQPSRTQKQIEVTIIHVDKYGIYAPNLVFYWDPVMNKQKVAALTGIAEQLRNKNAVITYASTSDIPRDKRPVLVDIAAFKREIPLASDTAPPIEPSGPSPAGSDKGGPGQPKEGLKSEKEEAVVQKPKKEIELGQAKPVSTSPPTISRAEVTNFVHHCIDAARSKDLDRSLGCYGEQVDYYSKGTVDKDFIRKDKGYYFRNWDRISSSIDGDVVLIVIDQPDLRIAKFNSRFQVENAKSKVSGRAENVWKIQKIGNELKIVDEKQKIIERD
jgi:hypothetical protein